MPRIKITASDGEVLTGTLPDSWGTTPLAPYASLATAATIPETCEAVAQLLGVPAEVFLSDVSHLVPIRRAAPWLFDGTLPDVPDEVPATIHHHGQGYRHVGSLDKIDAQQMGALLHFLQEHEQKPLTAAPALLAVLYCPVGKKQTAEVVAATTTAFETLPVSVGWGALMAFFRSGASAALHIRTVLAPRAFGSMPRPYIHHVIATVRHLRQHYSRQPMKELASELGIPARKLYSLAAREGIKKERRTD